MCALHVERADVVATKLGINLSFSFHVLFSQKGFDVVQIKVLTHSSPRVNICVSQTLHIISVSRGWGLKEICWCQIETNLDVVS